MTKFYQTDEFKKLNKKWKERLEKDGFEDAEQDDGNLKTWVSHYFRIRHTGVRAEAKRDYFRFASQFLHEYKFETERDYKIWYHHSSGATIREIAKLIGKNRTIVFNTIKRLSAVMHKRLTSNATNDQT